MANVIILAGCLFQPLIFRDLPFLEDAKSTKTYTLSKKSVLGNNDLVTIKGGKKEISDDFAFDFDKWQAEIKSLQIGDNGKYVVSCCKGKHKQEYKVVTKEPIPEGKSLKVEKIKKNGKNVLRCGTFSHFGEPRVPIIWKIDCKEINEVNYTYNERTGSVEMELPDLCKEERSYFPDPKDICKYYQCSGFGSYFLRTCAPGTKWNQQKEVCVHLGAGEACQVKTTTTTAASIEKKSTKTAAKKTPKPANPKPANPKPANPKPANPKPATATAATVVVIDNADTSGNASSDDASSGEASSADASSVVKRQASKDQARSRNVREAPKCTSGQMYMEDPEDKCRFYQCREGGKASHMYCAPGTQWYQQNETCVHFADTPCDPSDKYCKADKNQFYYEDYANKCWYYQCDEQFKIFHFECNSGTKWNQNITACEHFEEGEDCHGKNESMVCNNVNGGQFYYEHPTNKCRYYQCDSSERFYDKSCAPGTKWSQTIMTCIHLSDGETCTSDFLDQFSFTCSVDKKSIKCDKLELVGKLPDVCEAPGNKSSYTNGMAVMMLTGHVLGICLQITQLF